MLTIEILECLQQAFLTAFELSFSASAPFPVIVDVDGSVVGLGVDIMCAYEVRYAAWNSWE